MLRTLPALGDQERTVMVREVMGLQRNRMTFSGVMVLLMSLHRPNKVGDHQLILPVISHMGPLSGLKKRRMKTILMKMNFPIRNPLEKGTTASLWE